MNRDPHSQARRPMHFASALVIWFAALLSFGGLQPANFNLGQSPQASSDAARAIDLPAQRSTAPSLQSRLALLSERSLEALPASGFDGPETAVLPALRLDLPLYVAARGDAPLPSLTLSARPAGFRARAPPILA
ncbi:MAG: hypothetical protein KF694_24080 [Mesorhizobium sp.]|nr:hypothetical protein [Mesorhizobium sp.]